MRVFHPDDSEEAFTTYGRRLFPRAAAVAYDNAGDVSAQDLIDFFTRRTPAAGVGNNGH